jgi:hypothetical protein
MASANMRFETPPVASCFFISSSIFILGKIILGVVFSGFFSSLTDSFTCIDFGAEIMI